MNMTAQSPVTVVGNRQNVFMPIGSPATNSNTGVAAPVDGIKWKTTGGPAGVGNGAMLPSLHHPGGVSQQQQHQQQLVTMNTLQVANSVQSNLTSLVHQQQQQQQQISTSQTIAEVNNNRIVLRPESLRPGTINIVQAGGQTYVGTQSVAPPPPPPSQGQAMSPGQQQQQFQLRFQSSAAPAGNVSGQQQQQMLNSGNIPISHEGVIRISPASQQQQSKYVAAVQTMHQPQQHPMISPDQLNHQPQNHHNHQQATQIVATNFVPSIGGGGVAAGMDGLNTETSNHQQVIKPTFKNGLAGHNMVYQWHTLLPIISATPVRPQNHRVMATGNGHEGHGNGSNGGNISQQQRTNGVHNEHMNELSHQMSQSPLAASNQGMVAAAKLNSNILHHQQQNMLHVQQKMAYSKQQQPPTPPPEPIHPPETDEGIMEEEAIDDDVFETPEVPTQSSKGNNVHKSGPRTANSGVQDQLEAAAETSNQQMTTVKRRTQSCSAVPLGSKEPQSPMKVSRMRVREWENSFKDICLLAEREDSAPDECLYDLFEAAPSDGAPEASESGQPDGEQDPGRVVVRAYNGPEAKVS